MGIRANAGSLHRISFGRVLTGSLARKMPLTIRWPGPGVVPGDSPYHRVVIHQEPLSYIFSRISLLA
jgi:hypothetical protein